ncbi:MAG: hypothetical protein CMF74_14420 [Maricaulis sp.]|jgi:hypothetical protein|nr:hypothetical protein [Maricaulis sp.]|tara:strand:+ start:222 stop:677 length:456 start_codon:yes stop_codon:yes gene_type:complete
MIIDNNFLSKDECSYYVNKANKNVEPYDWDKRVVFIHDDTSLISKTINYFKQYNLFLKLDDIHIQTWPVNSSSDLHIHGDKCDWDDGRKNTKYNTLIYLNDDYDGGEFYTNNVTLKPKKGTITLFDGTETYHGVKPVKKKERYTIILWWKK